MIKSLEGVNMKKCIIEEKFTCYHYILFYICKLYKMTQVSTLHKGGLLCKKYLTGLNV